MPEKPVRLYTDLAFRATPLERSLMPIVWAHVDNGSDTEKLTKHHARWRSFKLVQTMEKADWCVLPSTWNAYVRENKTDLAAAFCQTAAEHGKLVLVWCGGDSEWILPLENAVQVQEGLHDGLQRRVHLALERPGFVEDYIERFENGVWAPLAKADRPRVGFCGLAAPGLRYRTLFHARNLATKVRYACRRSDVVPVLHGDPVALRLRALRHLDQHPGVETSFIVRRRYLAGLGKADLEGKLAHPTRTEFVNNILENGYTVCVRGQGNFSKRFYETLACGRIPVLVSTDSMLPFDGIVDWNRYIVRVEHHDLDRLGDTLCDFHASLSPEDFVERQAACRQLWLEMLSTEGYYSNFYRYLTLGSREGP